MEVIYGCGYYGRYNDIKPKEDLSIMILDEHLMKLINKQEELFKDNLHDFMRDFKVECKKEILKVHKEMCSFKKQISELSKQINGIIKRKKGAKLCQLKNSK